MNITIIGSGYVGLVSATCFADLGNNVLCLDVDKKKIQLLKNSKIPFYEPGLASLASKTIASNNLKFDSTYKEVISFSDVIFICVGTPQYKNGNPNLKYLKSCINSIVEQYKKEHADKLLHLFIKSTIAPGTIKKLQKKIILTKKRQ